VVTRKNLYANRRRNYGKKYKIVLSLVIVFVLLFGRNSMNITAQASGDASDNNGYA